MDCIFVICISEVNTQQNEESQLDNGTQDNTAPRVLESRTFLNFLATQVNYIISAMNWIRIASLICWVLPCFTKIIDVVLCEYYFFLIGHTFLKKPITHVRQSGFSLKMSEKVSKKVTFACISNTEHPMHCIVKPYFEWVLQSCRLNGSCQK